MTKIKMLFCSGSFDGTGKEGAILTSLIKKELEQYFDVYLISELQECVVELRKLGHECIYLYDKIEKINVSNVWLELEILEKKYNFCAEKVLFGDVDYSSIDRKKALTDMVKMFYFWESYLNQEKFDFIFGGIVRYFGLIPYIISKNIKPTIFLGGGDPIFPGRFCLTGNIFGEYNLLDYYLSKKNLYLSEIELKDIYELIDSYRKGSFLKVIPMEYYPQININKLRYLWDRLKVFPLEKKSPYLRILRGIKKQLQKYYRIFYTKLLPFYSFPNNDNYFYYPLQVHDDSNRLVWNNSVPSQLSLIIALARSLPANCYLYVKEHPAAAGGKSLRELREIKKIPRVKLISPYLSGRELIIHSKGLVTLSGTSGIEALILRKPVISLGKAYYNNSKLVHYVGDLINLDKIMFEVYFNNPLPSEEELLNFLKAYRKSCYEGRLFMRQYFYSNVVENKKVINPKNANCIAKGIYESYLLSLKIRKTL